MKELDVLIVSNEELEKIEKGEGEYANLSEEARKERKSFLEEQNTRVLEIQKNLSKVAKEIKDLEEDYNKETDKKKKDDIQKKLKEKRNEIKSIKKGVDKTSQGKVKNILSSYVGQIDKRVHNFIYNKMGKFSDTLWKLHTNMVNKRYNNTLGYILKNSIIALTPILVPAVISLAFPAVASIIPSLAVASGVFIGNTAIKAAAAYYNKMRYGDKPALERTKTIQKGSFIDNIKNSLFKRKSSKKLISNVNSLNIKGIVDSKTPDKAPIDADKKDDSEKVTKLVEAIKNADTTDLSEENIVKLQELLSKSTIYSDKLPDDEELKNKIAEIKDTIDKFNKGKDSEEEKPEEKEPEKEKVETKEEPKKEEKKFDNIKDKRVRRIIEKVSNLDVNKLDEKEINELIGEVNSLNGKQKNQLPGQVFVILGKARKELEEKKKLNDKEKEFNTREVLRVKELIGKLDIKKIEYLKFLNKKYSEVATSMNKIKDEKVRNNSYKELDNIDKEIQLVTKDEREKFKTILDAMLENKAIIEGLSKEDLLIVNEYNNTLRMNVSKESIIVNDRIIKKARVVVNEVLDKDGNVAYYSANATFYGYDGKILYNKQISLQDNNIEVVKKTIYNEIPNFSGEIDFIVNSKSKGNRK